MKNKWKEALGLILSLLFLWLALRKVEWSELPAVFAAADFRLLPLLLVSYTLEYLLRAFRWCFILYPKNIPFADLYAGLVLGYFFNNIFPARAGEFIRAWYLQHKGCAGFSETFASVVMERLLDGVCVVSFIACAVTMFPLSPAIRSGGYTAVVFYGVVLMFVLVVQFGRNKVDACIAFVLQPFPAVWKEWTEKILASFMNGLSLVRHPKQLVYSLALSLLAWTASILSYYIVIKIFNLHMGLRETLLLIAVMSLGAMIPSSPGMIGVYEYCCILVLNGILGMSRETAVAYALASHCLSYFYVIAIGMAVLTAENLRISELESAVES